MIYYIFELMPRFQDLSCAATLSNKQIMYV